MGLEMTNQFGPTRGHLKFRLAFPSVGLAMLIAAVAYRGWPTGTGGWEAIGIALLFFGDTFSWTQNKLMRKDYQDGL